MSEDKNVRDEFDLAKADEITLTEIMKVVIDGKWIVISITALCSVLIVIYSLSLPNIYRSTALLAPVEQEPSFGGIPGQLGGLASLAGINLGGGASNNTQLALEVISSQSFIRSFIRKHNLLPDLMAVEAWEQENNTVVYNHDIYLKDEKKWVEHSSLMNGSEPSMQKAYKTFTSLFGVNTDKNTGMVRLSIEHVSPYIAQQWLTWLIEDINETMRKRDVSEANKSTEFLKSQIAKTQIADIREVLYKLVEEQAKTIMFANVRDEYVFTTIDPALVPEEKSGPKRALICIFGAIFGGILGMIVAIIKWYSKKK